MNVSPIRILIVEDDLALQPFWNIVLKRCFKEWTSDWAVSAEEAKRMMTQARHEGVPYSLVISDIFLAGSETGLDLFNAKDELQTSIKFLLVSVAEANRVKDSVDEFTGDSAVLTKPLNLPKCERAINQLLNRGA